VGSIILAPGFQPFDPSSLVTYNYINNLNVVTSIEFERLLSASGPTMGKLLRPSDKKEPEKIAWIQCVGSRDVNTHTYCSAVCCMYAIKEAVVAKEHAVGVDCAIFYMDMRTYGKDFERYYERAKNEGIRFLRTKPHSIEEDGSTKDLILRYINEQGELKEEKFNMVVLSVGIEVDSHILDSAKKLGIDTEKDGFAKIMPFSSVSSLKKGVYICGLFSEPKDIPSSVMEASAAASEAKEVLAPVRGTLVKEKVYPEQIDVSSQEPRIGVFVCNCGINIGGIIDVPSVAEYARSLPGVVYVEENLFTCAQDTQEKMKEIIKSKKSFIKKELPREDAIKLFKGLGEAYKVELLNEITDETVTIYKEDSFIDLCRGPHIESTGKVKAFKLLSVAGAYWRGDEHNKMLQRIYGAAFFTKDALKQHLDFLEEVKKRDHRRLGKELALFSINDEVGAGLVLWHPRGAAIRRAIENFWTDEHYKAGYQILYTPHMAKLEL